MITSSGQVKKLWRTRARSALGKPTNLKKQFKQNFWNQTQTWMLNSHYKKTKSEDCRRNIWSYSNEFGWRMWDDVWQQNMWSRQDGRYSIFNRIISASKFLKYSRITAEILFVSCALFSIGNPKIKFKWLDKTRH